MGEVHSSLNMAEQVPIVLDVVHDDRSLKMLLMKLLILFLLFEDRRNGTMANGETSREQKT